MSDPPKSRARGRSARPTAAAAPGAAGPPAAQAQAAPAAPPTNVRARARAAPAAASAAQQERPGLLTQQMGQMSLGSTGSSDTDTPGSSVGRGMVRGRRVNEESTDKLIRTKPQHIHSKRAISTNPKLQQTMFTVNYFKLLKTPTWTLNLYRVDFNPPEDVLCIKRALVYAHKADLAPFLFDGTVLFTPRSIPGGERKFISQKRDRADAAVETPVEITVRHARVLEHGDFQYLQLFNILVRDTLRGLDLKLMGRDYFDPAAKQLVPQFKMEVWPGYETVIRQHESDILLCAGIKHKVLRKENALEVWQKCNNDKRAYEAIMTNTTVLTQYNDRTFKVDDIDFECNPTKTFSMKGENVSYIEYYQKKYNITIRDRNQPMIIHKSKGREVRAGQSELIYLVPELCTLTGLTDEMRSNFQIMKALGDITRVPPREVINKLNVFRRRIENSEASSVYKKWDLALDTSLVKVQGHLLPMENIVLGAGRTCTGGPEVDFTKGLRSNPLFRVVPLQRWALVTTSFMQQDTRSFVQYVQKAAQGMSFPISIPKEFIIPNDRAQTYALELEKILSNDQYTLIMAIIPSNQADRYNSIKRKCAIDRAVPSQVIVKRNLNSKGTLSIATKVAIQLCCKIGGAPWTVEVPMKGMMVLGFDVTHDTDLKGSSYGALVASLDPMLSSYFSAVSPHSAGGELSSDIALNVVRALQVYKERNQAYPRALIFYRDGVGEGQINHVVETELGHIQRAIADIKVYEANKIPLSFIIVTKRIHSRIMVESGTGNPPPGSVVDDVITAPERYDFFLVSQSVRQGTVTPTYFNVVHDTNPAINPERLQRLTYKLCHLYYNWAGTVRVPAPCQYAHKLAFLCGQSLHRAPDARLGNLLHYL